ncbi:HEAT repeat domain-containing protein [Branchiibius sp. NY16-3462-2]|uniref:HEAT repeat domain-containing protein n=1 Tax=Branchiibius sp. NY16-3462-2 TaxID=1807500 RepID=UPI0007958075|nr:HEAT repeat domain-containing protein [Branchiibius sp. NY16-3462-2]KYH43987.1 hypothetical protein AZH51_04370 [Branchiibius sp. NY16-3462-2]
MTTSTYPDELATLDPSSWNDYLRQHSHLPGPRANLSLVDAFVHQAGSAQIESALATDEEFLVLCGVAALSDTQRLRGYASDARWRVREGVALSLQHLGDRDPGALHDLVLTWASDADPLVQRAAVAAICEPRLLTSSPAAAVARSVCHIATSALVARPSSTRREPDVRVLRQALGYGWSVAIAADPEPGLAAFTTLQSSGDPDVAWVVRENLKKARLKRLLPASDRQ